MNTDDTDLTRLFEWRPPENWTRITTIDMHTGGEPLRVIVDGLPPIEGTMSVKVAEVTKWPV